MEEDLLFMRVLGKDKKDKKDKSKEKKKDKKKDKSKDKKKDKKKDKSKEKKKKDKSKEKKKDKAPSRNSSDVRLKEDQKLSKKELEAARENTADKLRRGLELKKKLVEVWDKIQRDATGKKPITSPEMLLLVLEDCGFMSEIVRHVGQRKAWRIADGREISTVHLAEPVKVALAHRLFEYIDLDGNREISMNELLLVLDALGNPDRVERAKFHFVMMDADGDGRLDRQELEKMFRLTVLGMKVALELDINARREELREEGVADSDVDQAKTFVMEKIFDNPELVRIGVDLLLKKVDSNKNGVIEEQEWVSWIENRDNTKAYEETVREKVLKPLQGHQFTTNPSLQKLVEKSLESVFAIF